MNVTEDLMTYLRDQGITASIYVDGVGEDEVLVDLTIDPIEEYGVLWSVQVDLSSVSTSQARSGGQVDAAYGKLKALEADSGLLPRGYAQSVSPAVATPDEYDEENGLFSSTLSTTIVYRRTK